MHADCVRGVRGTHESSVLGRALLVPLTPGGGVFVDPLEGGVSTKITVGFFRADPLVFADFFALNGQHFGVAVPLPSLGMMKAPIRFRGIQTDILAPLLGHEIFVTLDGLTLRVTIERYIVHLNFLNRLNGYARRLAP